MATFYGKVQYAIDEKGRIVVPASMRTIEPKKSHKTFVLLSGFDDCVYLYAEEDFEKEFGERLAAMSMGNERMRALARAFLSEATKVTVDVQGRISIPLSLRTEAGLGKEAVLLGGGHRLEIWAPDRFESSLKGVHVNRSALYNEMLASGDTK